MLHPNKASQHTPIPMPSFYQNLSGSTVGPGGKAKMLVHAAPLQNQILLSKWQLLAAFLLSMTCLVLMHHQRVQGLHMLSFRLLLQLAQRSNRTWADISQAAPSLMALPPSAAFMTQPLPSMSTMNRCCMLQQGFGQTAMEGSGCNQGRVAIGKTVPCNLVTAMHAITKAGVSQECTKF